MRLNAFDKARLPLRDYLILSDTLSVLFFQRAIIACSLALPSLGSEQSPRSAVRDCRNKYSSTTAEREWCEGAVAARAFEDGT